jgi:hypothetical protein
MGNLIKKVKLSKKNPTVGESIRVQRPSPSLSKIAAAQPWRNYV